MSKSNLARISSTVALLAAGAVLAACGGGGGGSSVSPPPPPPVASPPPPPPPPPPVSSATTWTEGTFEPAATFKDQCEVPRSGQDIAGQPFPDEAGSLAEELFWLRSWTEETYLWYREVEDVDPNTFTNVLSYFDVLKTDASTPAGLPRDRFHFTDDTAEDLRRRLSAPEPSYGFELVVVNQGIPRDWRILYTEPNTPASEVTNGQSKLVRGSRIWAIDGVDFINGGTQAEVDVLNDGLFPDTVGETHEFTIQDPGSNTLRTVTLAAENIAAPAVNRTLTLDTPTGPVGYILFNTFGTNDAEQEIAAAMTELSNAGVTDLVLDLRYNRGGFLDISAQTAYMIAGPTRTTGRIYDTLVINDNPDNFLAAFNLDTPFHSTGQDFSLTPGTPLDDLDLGRVFVLTTEDTCSASEAVINGLRGIGVEVIQIGDRTCGKPYGFIGTDNCGTTFFTIQFGSANDIGFGDYAEGFAPTNASGNLGVRVPGCQVADDDLDNELGSPNEALLSAALNYRDTLSCPTVTSSSSSKVALLDATSVKVTPTDMILEERPPIYGSILRLPE